MPELWLPVEDRLALWDPAGAQLRVVGWRPGPSGVSAVQLTDELHVVMDHASPTTLAELAIAVPDDRTIDATSLALVARMLGDETTDRLAAIARGPVTPRPVPLRGWRDRDDEPPFDDEVRTFARLALAADLGDDAHLAAVGRAVALVEAALAAVDLHRPLGARLLDRGLASLSLTSPSFDPKRTAEIEGLVRRALLRLGPDVDPIAAERALDHVRRGGEGRRHVAEFAAQAAGAPVAAAMPAAAAKAATGRVRAADADDEASPRGRPIAVDGDHRAWAWLDGGNNVRVTAAPSAKGAWARVFRTRDRLLLGLAPLRVASEPGQLDALVVIPPPADAGGLVVDVVTDPATPRRAPVHDAYRAAVRAGRTAARLARRRDPEAVVAWSEAAAQWQSLGDEQRANLARRQGRRDDVRYPSARGRGAAVDPLLADRLDA